MKKKLLVTGAAGFIGFHLIKKIYENFDDKIIIVGIDNINSYYSVDLKIKRISELEKRCKRFLFKKIDIKNYNKIFRLFNEYKFDYVVNLAAQAGVRFSLKHPKTYIENNINGFFNILDCSKKFKIKHLVFASSSSVYGEQKKYPFKENFDVTNPEQLYAATKVSNELMSSAYSRLYNMKITGLRFFSVYGPWGRPDMAIFSFVKKLYERKKINIFNRGNHYRNFTYIEDLVDATSKILLYKKDFFKKKFNIFNVGGNKTIKLSKLINYIEIIAGKEFKKNYVNKQKGDVFITSACNLKIQSIINYKPKTNIIDGLKKFISWYKQFYNINS
jgi:UDP-glucuronate 4-epimerase